MSKKGQAQVVIVVLLIVIILFLLPTGLNNYKQYFGKDYTIKTSTEKTDFNFGSRIQLFYEIENNGELTLVPKLSVIVNETCFYEVSDKETNEIPPGKTEKSYVYVESKSSYNLRDSCTNQTFPIEAQLLDVNGKLLDDDTIFINITR